MQQLKLSVENDVPNNLHLKHYTYNHIFSDDDFKKNVHGSDYIIIDNQPVSSGISRYEFSKFVVQYKKEDSKIILDNGTWNVDAYKFLFDNFFCRDFPGVTGWNMHTVTSLFFLRKSQKYYIKKQ